jgi:hypothetical protein
MSNLNARIKEFGEQFGDRKNSFDDAGDIKMLSHMMRDNLDLRNYILSRLPVDFLKPKPDDEYGVDIGMFSEDRKRIGTIDVERLGAWKEDWPFFYRHIHFLGRKEKFCKPNFFMAFLNNTRNKVIMLENNDIIKYPTIEKYFSYKNMNDHVKELPFSAGRIFGTNITEKERSLFQ